MKVEFLKGGAGFGLAYSAGAVADLDADFAEKLIEAGVVIPAKEKKAEKETADSKAPKEKKAEK